MPTIVRVLITGVLTVYILYALFTVAMAVRLILTNFKDLPPSRQALADLIVLHAAPPNRRYKIQGFLALPSQALAWPVAVLQSGALLRRKSNMHYSAQEALAPRDAYVAVALAGILGITALCHALSLSYTPWIWLMACLGLLALVTKELSQLVGSLSERLRQSRRNPYQTFAFIAVADAVVLVLTLALIISLLTQRQLDLPLLTETTGALFNLPRNVLDLLNLAPTAMAIAGLGFFYYVAIIKTLTTRSHFVRTSKDYERLASYAVMAGHPDEARQWLEKDTERSASWFLAKVQVALSEGDLEAAAEAAGRICDLRGEPNTPNSRLLLMGNAAVLSNIDSETALRLARYSLQSGSDYISATVVPLALLTVEDANQLALQLLVDVDGDAYPLTRCNLLVRLGQLQDAMAILDDARPGAEIEEVLRLIRQCSLRILDPNTTVQDTREYVVTWIRESLPTVVELASELQLAQRYAAMYAVLELDGAHRRFLERWGGYGDHQEEIDRMHTTLQELADELSSSDAELLRARGMTAELLSH